jgi:hypothetical protein
VVRARGDCRESRDPRRALSRDIIDTHANPMSPVHLFPASGFDQSATTPVFLGVLVSWFFTETFGWVFAGLVVPGYLAALFMIDPRAATIDVLEAVLTYAVARVLGEHLARTGLTSRLFGRERFFLVVLVSILVRLGVEGVALQRLAPQTPAAFSIGLVVVPLTANACWKTGLGRGLAQNGVPTLIVYLLLRFVLMPYTNLSLATFSLATENIAASFLSAPKAYILVLTGAVLGAAANLRYGWDFNGILIPALLALIVVDPLKLTATLVEVVVLVAAARALLAITPLGRWNIEGPRRLVLFFAIDYALRFGIAAVIGRRLPGADVVDLMGFGYLLPTLLAVKISQTGISALVLLPAFTVSFGAFALGTVVGFGATALDGPTARARAVGLRPIPRAPTDPTAAALWVSALARPQPLRGAEGESLSPSKLATLVDDLLSDPGHATPPHLDLQRIDRGALLVRERFDELADRVGDPSVLIAPDASPSRARVVVVVPTPLHAPESAALGGRLLADGAIDALVVAGIEESAARPLSLQTRAASIARAIAHRRGTAPRGIVIELRRVDAADASVRLDASLAAEPRLAGVLERVRALAGELPEVGAELGGDIDASIALPLDRANRWLSGEAPPLSLSSAAAMAMALDGLRPSLARRSVEEALLLRRLVLEPLLGPSGPRESIALVRFAASALGYSLQGPTLLADGEPAFALIPAGEPRPLALIARAGGVRATVIEVPYGFHQGGRDVALRLDTPPRADALLFGLEPEVALLGNEALREAAAVATSPAPDRKAALVLVREGQLGRDDGGAATIGSWGGNDVSTVVATLEAGLRERGFSTSEEPIDREARDAAGRSVFGDLALATVTVDAGIVRGSSFAAVRAAARRFAELPIMDASCGEVARRLSNALPDSTSPPAPADLLDIARRAAVEESVVARRALDQAIARTQARAGIARTRAGLYLVVVGRARGALVASAIAASNPEAPPNKPPDAVPTLDACEPLLAFGGACRVVVP